jgi:predicted nucleotidyltransferase
MVGRESLRQILRDWAKTLPCKVRIHLFGSYVKGNLNPSDIDVSLEFLHPYTKDERTHLWFDYHSAWEQYLCDATGLKIHLCLLEGDDSPRMQQSLKDASVLIYDANDNS